MKTNKLLLELLSTFLTLVLFNLLFWGEKMGINLFIFSSILLLIQVFFNGHTLQKKETIVSVGAFLISGITTVIVNSELSILIHIVAFAVALFQLKSFELTTVYDTLIAFIQTYILLPVHWYRRLQKDSEKHPALALGFKYAKLGLVPLIMVSVFFMIYRGANPKFEALTADFSILIINFFKGFSLARLIFIAFGFTFISVALSKLSRQLTPLIKMNDSLKRTKKTYDKRLSHLRGSLVKELLNEYKVGVIVLLLLNLLIFIVNLIDLNWIYFGFEVPENFNLKQFVHEGTYLLILSILLSMVIVLYLFRDSLNFYKKNKALVVLGKIWIIQNAFLTLSVFVRNFHYISYHGLASKRIGMIAFLLMCLFGLVTLIIKVGQKKSTFYLLRVNTWFIFISLVFLSLFNWDRVIIQHNLHHENIAEIDTDHYLELDPRLSPMIYQNLDLIEKQMQAHQLNRQVWVNVLDIQLFEEKLKKRASLYHQKQKGRSWASWNLKDQYFNDHIALVKPQNHP